MLLDVYLEMMEFLPLEYWKDVFFVLKIIAAILTVIFLGVIIYLLRNSGYAMFHYGSDMRDFLMIGMGSAKRIAKQWGGIVRRINSGNDAERKLTIIEADKFVDEVVQHIGGQGNTLGERLASLPAGSIQHLDELWAAHKVRNNIVHDPDYRLTQEKAKEVIGQYEEVLKEFEMI